MPPLDSSLPTALEGRGVSRRDFMEFCSLIVATLSLPTRYLDTVVAALTQTQQPVLVWLEFQDWRVSGG
jgi:hydrogenase small subunit